MPLLSMALLATYHVGQPHADPVVIVVKESAAVIAVKVGWGLGGDGLGVEVGIGSGWGGYEDVSRVESVGMGGAFR